MANRNPVTIVIVLYLLSILSMSLIPMNIEKTTLDEEAFVAQSEQNNSRGWLSSASGDADVMFNDAVVYSDTGILLGGHFQEQFFFNGNISGHMSNDTQNFRQDMILVWLDSNGTWNRSMNLFSDGVDTISKIQLFSDGDIAIAGKVCVGTYGVACTFEPEPLTEKEKFSVDEDGFSFVGRLSQDGEWRWMLPFHSESESFIVDMDVDDDDNVNIAIHHTTQLYAESTFYVASDGGSIVYFNLNQSGNVTQSIQYFSDTALGEEGCIVSSLDGSQYLGFTFQGQVSANFELLNSSGGSDILLSKINEEGVVWNIIGGGSDDEALSDCIESSGDVRVVGNYFGTPSFGNNILPAAQWIDVFDIRLNSDGEWGGVTTFGGAGKDSVKTIIETDLGETYFAGTITSSISFGSTTLPDLSSGNDADVYLALQTAEGTWDWGINAGGSSFDIVNTLLLGPTKDPMLAIASNGDGTYGPNQFTHWGSGFNGLMWLFGSDRDEDGILDGQDNCPLVANVDQINHDGDAFGNACDPDDDNDGVPDENDDCNPGKINWESNAMTDHDGDGCYDDSEDFDDDEDGVFDDYDACPRGPVGWVSTAENDVEGDGCSDEDTDGDGHVDQADNCPNIENVNQKDLDGDGIGNACDDDEDGDGILNSEDGCPTDDSLWSSTIVNDHDQDGCKDDGVDEDDDNDGVSDDDDACPKGEVNWDENPTSNDHDGDGCSDGLDDEDDDGDGVLDSADTCPLGVIGFLSEIDDKDGDGCLDSSEDVDDDNDGVIDDDDACPLTTLFQTVNTVGCSQFQLDDDGDGIKNIQDICLSTTPGVQVDDFGCEVIQTGTDSTSVQDDDDSSPLLLIIGLLVVALCIYIFKNQDLLQQVNSREPPTQTHTQQPDGRAIGQPESQPESHQEGEQKTDELHQETPSLVQE